MAKNKNINLLESQYLGQLVNYRNREFKLLTYKQETELITLVTDDGEWIKTNIYDLGVMLDEFEIILPQTLEKMVKKFESAPLFFSVKNEAVERSQKSLLKALEEIEDGTVNHAKINSIVSLTEAIIKTEKVKIEMVNSMNSAIRTNN